VTLQVLEESVEAASRRFTAEACDWQNKRRDAASTFSISIRSTGEGQRCVLFRENRPHAVVRLIAAEPEC
jgi:hypothetical protein